MTMTTSEPNEAPSPGTFADRAAQQLPALRLVWRGIRTRIVEGLLVTLPLLVTFWIIRWMYRGLETYVIDPLAVLVLWKARQLHSQPELPYWFETYVAPLISIILALVILYCCGALAHSWFRRSVDKVLLRIPLVSPIYDSVRNVLQCLAKPGGQATPQRIVLVSFPHPGMRLPAIVTATCRDTATQKTLLCVYVPTTPVPSSGFFLIVPEESATDLNWTVQQTLQAIISGGLTAPPEISYYQTASPSNGPPGPSPLAGQTGHPDSSGKG